MRDSLNWFEIPAADIERAAKFYGALFNTTLEITPGDGFSSTMLPYDGGVGGGIVQGEGYTPNTQGSLVYLNANAGLDAMLARVVAAGGQVIKPKTDIAENGFYALILDTEGNRIGLHSVS